MSSNTHECEKLHAVAEQSQKIGEFLDWLLNAKGYVLAKWDASEDGESGDEDQLTVQYVTINSLLAEYFKIDLNKVELERRSLMRDLHVSHRERNREQR